MEVSQLTLQTGLSAATRESKCLKATVKIDKIMTHI